MLKPRHVPLRLIDSELVTYSEYRWTAGTSNAGTGMTVGSNRSGDELSLDRGPDVELDRAVRAELLQTLFAQAFPTLIVDVIVLGAIVVLLASVGAPPGLLLPWATGVAIAALARYMFTKRFEESKPGPMHQNSWYWGFLLTTIAYAAIWGLAGIYFIVPGSDASLVVAIFLLCGLGAGAVVVYSASAQTMFLVLVALFAPFSLNMIQLQNEPNRLALVLALSWACFAAFLGWRSHNQLRQRIYHQIEALHLASDRDTARAEAEERNAAKSVFMAKMNHELRTPLNAIIGFTDAMRSKLFGSIGNPVYEEYVDAVHSSGQHLNRLIGDLLDISKMEAGQFEIVRQPDVDVANLVNDCISLASAAAAEAGVEVVADVGDDAGTATLDPTRIRQALLNLVINAIKYSKKGGVVRVRCAREFDRIVLMVEDDGCGMLKESINKALQPFQQLEQDPYRASRGLGLGLAIVKGLTEAHGGELTIESAVQVGTTAKISLPGERNALPRIRAKIESNRIKSGRGLVHFEPPVPTLLRDGKRTPKAAI